MRKVIIPNRKYWCHRCRKEVLLSPHLWEDICSECQTELKPRLDEDFEEITEEEYQKRCAEE
jgi:DNA-directed RNA polymerase subunit RPC12/RpoP